jgi:hypothetical protein
LSISLDRAIELEERKWHERHRALDERVAQLDAQQRDIERRIDSEKERVAVEYRAQIVAM